MGVRAPRDVGASGRSPYAPADQATGVVQGTFSDEQVSAPFPFCGWFNVSLWASYSTGLTTTTGSLTAVAGTVGSIAKGNSIKATNVPAGTTIQGVSGSNLTLYIPPITISGKTKVGVAKITNLDYTTGLVGATVTGPGVPSGTTVLSVDTAAVVPNGTAAAILGTITISNTITETTDDDTPSPFVFVRNGNAITTTGADANAVFVGNELTFTGTVQLERSFDGGSTWIPCYAWQGGSQLKWTAAMSTEFLEPEKGVLYRLNCIAYSAGTINYRISTTAQAAGTSSGPL